MLRSADSNVFARELPGLQNDVNGYVSSQVFLPVFGIPRFLPLGVHTRLRFDLVPAVYGA